MKNVLTTKKFASRQLNLLLFNTKKKGGLRSPANLSAKYALFYAINVSQMAPNDVYVVYSILRDQIISVHATEKLARVRLRMITEGQADYYYEVINLEKAIKHLMLKNV